MDSDPHNGECDFEDRGATCENFYDCCDCGGVECRCPYCWSCNACDSCKEYS